jgi:hypothetical protein
MPSRYAPPAQAKALIQKVAGGGKNQHARLPEAKARQPAQRMQAYNA